MRAFRDAQHICIGWRLDGLPDPGFDRRMEIFCGPGWDDRDEWAPQAFDAATYPQSVALARLLASPYWRARILGNDWAWHDEFTAELRRTVAPDYTWDYRPPARWRRSRDDPLLEWRLHTRRLEFEPSPARPRLEPARNHPAGRALQATRSPRTRFTEKSPKSGHDEPDSMRQPAPAWSHRIWFGQVRTLRGDQIH